MPSSPPEITRVAGSVTDLSGTMRELSIPELLHFRVSHYNEKVRWALDYKGWPHRRTAVLAGFHIPRVRWLTGQNQVPVLLLDGEAIHDSTQIIAEIERRQPEPRLYPADDRDRARALAVEDHFDEVVAPELRRLFWSTYIDDATTCAKMATAGFGPTVSTLWRMMFPFMRPLLRRNLGLDRIRVGESRANLRQHLDDLERQLGPTGYIVGDRFSIADLTAAAVLTAVLRPPEFPYPLPEPWPTELSRVRASIVDHAASRWALDMYIRHRGTSAEVADEHRVPR